MVLPCFFIRYHHKIYAAKKYHFKRNFQAVLHDKVPAYLQLLMRINFKKNT